MTRPRLESKDYLILCGFLVLWVFVASRHELAHDEAQAWNIARSAQSWLDVIWHSRYEGHTPLWFAVLWPLAHTGNPIVMQALAVSLAIVVAALLLKSRRFPRALCILLMLSYFIGYEYALLPRPYIITLTLCALFATLLRHRGLAAFVSLCALCALIGFTSSFGLVLSASFMFLLLLEYLLLPASRRPAVAKLGAGLLGYGMTALFSVYYIVWPIEERSYETAVLTGQRVDILNWSKAMETAAFPHFDRLPMGIGDFLSSTALGSGLVAGSALLLVIGIFLMLSGKPAAALSWLVAVVLMTAASLVSGLSSERQMGHLYMAALVLIWIRQDLSCGSEAHRPVIRRLSELREKWFFGSLASAISLLLPLLVAYQALVGVGAMAMDVARPLTPWKQMYQHIQDTEPSSVVLITDHAYYSGSLLAQLDKPAFNMRCGCWIRYAAWQGTIIPKEPNAYGEALEKAWCNLKKDNERVLLLRTERFWPETSPFVPLVEFDKGYRTARPVGPVLYEADGDMLESC